MADARNELRDAGQHAKLAARATLKAVRSAIDYAIDRLDGGKGDDGGNAPPAETPPPRPGETPVKDDDRVV